MNTAILLLAHGTPNALGEMADYLSKVTSGRPLPAEVVAELQHRYAAIGLAETPGPTPPPLTRWTLAQADLLRSALADTGTPIPVYAAMRNWHPYIADVVAQLLADGITRIIAVCLAPQNSRTSTGLYRRALDAALASDPTHLIDLTFIQSWSDSPTLITAFAQRLAELYPRAAAETGSPVPILFTAHSVPSRTVQPTAENPTPDPYADQARHTAELVYQSAFPQASDTNPPHLFAFQSQGIAGGPWLGPTVEETLASLASAGHRGVILQPIGFVCDHVEVLYDIDIAFMQTARDLNLRLYRPQSLNDSPLLTQSLLEIIQPYLAS